MQTVGYSNSTGSFHWQSVSTNVAFFAIDRDTNLGLYCYEQQHIQSFTQTNEHENSAPKVGSIAAGMDNMFGSKY